MYVYQDDITDLSAWIRKEVVFARVLKNGSRGMGVRRVQEWLNLHDYGVVIDADFGPVTSRALARFQERSGLQVTGKLNDVTHYELVKPMLTVLRQRSWRSTRPEAGLLGYARAHLKQHPREVGGQNRGPWVRLYMKGHEGAQWAWCAGFIVFLLQQAVESLEIPMPFKGSFSCDSLAAQAQDAGLFVSERQAREQGISKGNFFLVRRTSTDWTHAGIVTYAEDSAFDTIEGNTNDDGEREGYEVCSRSRGYPDKDFILIT